MGSLKSELIYSAASVNRHPNCLDCEEDRLVFATSKSIAVFDKRRGCIVKYLHSHKDQVSGVQFIRSADESQNLSDNHNELYSKAAHWIMSTSYDKTAIIWKTEKNDDFYTPLYHLEGHEKAVVCGHSLWVPGSNNIDTLFTITSDIENITKLWAHGKLLHTLKTDYMVITSKIATISIASCSSVDLNILCLGGSDDTIHLFSFSNNSQPTHLIDIMGHSDWIRSIDIIKPLQKQPFLMLASAAQDKFIRVWGIHLNDNKRKYNIRKRTAPVTLSSEMDCLRPLFISAVLETVLAGHEGRVYDVKWSRIVHHDELSGSAADKIRLLSCSSDKSIITWQSTLTEILPESELNDLSSTETTITEDIWQEVYRVGEAGECNLGFLGACLSFDSSTIYAYTLHGAIHSWSSSDTIKEKPSSSIEWTSVQTVGGHFGPVTDLVWQEDGHYLITSSLDKTCRAHGYIEKLKRWNEISRPQVHGYEINCLTLVDNLRLASGADEKTIRLFEATTFFVKTFQKLSHIDLVRKELSSKELAACAQVPALGLSNRAISLNESDPNEPNYYYDEENNFNCPDGLSSVPVEEILLQSTIWPEIQKLYGHSHEIYSLASDNRGAYLASACKANKSEFAVVIIWDLATFDKISTLSHHTLTVTRLRYSPNNRYLLSVSRDRTWCLWENELTNDFPKLASTTNRTTRHSRIIWDCSWTPDSSYFLTVSRDKKAIVWSTSTVLTTKPDELITDESQYLSLEDSIQAVDTQDSIEEKILPSGQTMKVFFVAFGLEIGHIVLSKLSTVDSLNKTGPIFEWTICSTIDSHRMPIRRLSFRPVKVKSANGDDTILASASDDCSVSLHLIKSN